MEKHIIADGVKLFYDNTDIHFQLDFYGEKLYKYDSVKCVLFNGDVFYGFLEEVFWNSDYGYLTRFKLLKQETYCFLNRETKIYPNCRLVLFEKYNNIKL